MLAISFACRPHLNFITGENGSGKSATLQCLQVCLGARARDTGRSTAAKGLINDEASSATARTVLWNTVRPLQLLSLQQYISSMHSPFAQVVPLLYGTSVALSANNHPGDHHSRERMLTSRSCMGPPSPSSAGSTAAGGPSTISGLMGRRCATPLPGRWVCLDCP